MLGKLFRHEWKTVWRIPTLMVVISLLSAVMCGLSMAFPIWGKDWDSVNVLMIFIVMLFYTVAVVASSCISIYLAVRFYKSMFTDEGYLTHTLPATSSQILISKAAVMSIWNLISIITIMISVFIFIFAMLTCAATGSEKTLQDLMYEISTAVQSGEFAGWQGFLGVTVLFSLISCISGTMMLIGSVCIGQMVRKHRVLGAIGAYFAITAVVQTISTICTIPWFIVKLNDFETLSAQTVNVDTSIFQIYIPLFCTTGIIAVIVSIAMFFISNHLVKKQLELE